jgi:hypothetical protein
MPDPDPRSARLKVIGVELLGLVPGSLEQLERFKPDQAAVVALAEEVARGGYA